MRNDFAASEKYFCEELVCVLSLLHKYIEVKGTKASNPSPTISPIDSNEWATYHFIFAFASEIIMRARVCGVHRDSSALRTSVDPFCF